MLAWIFYIGWFGLSLFSVVRLLLQKREPSSTLAWIFFTTFVPIFGTLLFLVFGPIRLERKAIRRKQEIERMMTSADLRNSEAGTERVPTPTDLAAQDSAVLKLAEQVSEYVVTSDNLVEILPDPQQTLLAMQAAIESAKHFIHLEYYIIASDDVTEQLFKNLENALERGVEVRILYDALGSLSLKRIYFRNLLKRGAKIAGFLPFAFFTSRFNVNFRNHRKILVVDGTTAFTGGTNIGKQYLGKFNEGQWRDYSVRIRGPVCRQLQDVFAKDWHFTTQEDLFSAQYYPPAERAGKSVVQVLESGPDSSFSTLHQMLFLMLNEAKHEILLTTPYFIPDSALMTTLTVAALRGVKVKLLLPMKSDAPFVQRASRSFYENLLRVGAEIYEYRPRILHAKMLVIDKKWTVLGSANMDIRSFKLNFEINLLVHGAEVALQAQEHFRTDLAQSRPIELASYLARPVTQRILENACRLFSPLL